MGEKIHYMYVSAIVSFYSVVCVYILEKNTKWIVHALFLGFEDLVQIVLILSDVKKQIVQIIIRKMRLIYEFWNIVRFLRLKYDFCIR